MSILTRVLRSSFRAELYDAIFVLVSEQSCCTKSICNCNIIRQPSLWTCRESSQPRSSTQNSLRLDSKANRILRLFAWFRPLPRSEITPENKKCFIYFPAHLIKNLDRVVQIFVDAIDIFYVYFYWTKAAIKESSLLSFSLSSSLYHFHLYSNQVLVFPLETTHLDHIWASHISTLTTRIGLTIYTPITSPESSSIAVGITAAFSPTGFKIPVHHLQRQPDPAST